MKDGRIGQVRGQGRLVRRMPQPIQERGEAAHRHHGQQEPQPPPQAAVRVKRANVVILRHDFQSFPSNQKIRIDDCFRHGPIQAERLFHVGDLLFDGLHVPLRLHAEARHIRVEQALEFLDFFVHTMMQTGRPLSFFRTSARWLYSAALA